MARVFNSLCFRAASAGFQALRQFSSALVLEGSADGGKTHRGRSGSPER